MEQIVGIVENIIFQNAETGYAVARLQETGKQKLTAIVGTMPSIQPGESIRCTGKWKTHLIHGSQFEVSEYRTEIPADVVGIRKYLGSGLIKGIGPTYAKRIVKVFGKETLNVIDEEPEKLLNIPGIGKKRAEKIRKCWSDQKSIREVMIFLQGHGVSPTYAQKIFKTYGNASIQKVKGNPYSLAKDIFGIGFKTADKIAEKMGIPHDADPRIDAGIEYTLSELSNEGHTCYPTTEFLDVASTMLEVGRLRIAERLEHLTSGERIVIANLTEEHTVTSHIWLKQLYVAEQGIVNEIRRLQRSPCRLRNVDATKALEWVQERLHIKLADNQKSAVIDALMHKMQIITGGPGTGKSTITNAILAITLKLTKKVFLAAPTGRAAKRMTEITRRKAFTIHSLLEFDFKIGGFKKNRQNPLDCDLIIIDEASMIDTLLMYHLLKAIPGHARIIFVGDINQLPSVGPGNVLRDIIDSQCVPIGRLNKIFRQAHGSQIVTNAHRINEGTFPYIGNDPHGDFFFIEQLEPEGILNTIVNIVKERVPRKYGLNPFEDIQVLSPMKRGVIGTHNLNVVMQDALNPKGKPLFQGGRQYRIGDKVMQIRNNYQKDIFNGDVGKITNINAIEHQVTILFDNREIIYDFSDLDEIVLAYAVSIHKYQGSECPCVVIPIHTTHFKLLHRNLFYTGVTRGKRLVILVGTKKALAIAVHNNEVQKRYTGLLFGLKTYFLR